MTRARTSTALVTEATGSEAAEISRASTDFMRQLEGYGLTTAEILYRMPDHRNLLQAYVWQDYDIAPRFPILRAFLNFWTREPEGPLHSVRVAHDRLIRPAELRMAAAEYAIN